MNWKDDKRKYIGIGACILGLVLLMRVGMTTNPQSKAMNEELLGAEPIKIGTEIVEKTADEQTIFRIVTSEIGEQYNPIFASTIGEKLMTELLFEPLAQRNEAGRYENVLAKEIVYDEETCTLTVTIKDDIVFANGVPLTSTHVRDSILFAILTGNSGAKYIVGASEFQKDSSTAATGVKLVDEQTLTIQFLRYEFQNMEILETLIQRVPALEWGEENFLDYAKDMLGNGMGTNAFILDSRNEYQVRLAKNPNYRHAIETIETVDVFEASAIDLRTEFASGAIDYMDVAYDSAAKDLILGNAQYDVYGKAHTQTIGLYINPDTAMGSNLTVQSLLQSVLDRNALCEGALAETLWPVTSILPAMILPHKDPDSFVNLSLVNAHMMALQNDINLQMIDNETKIMEGVPVPIPQEVLDAREETLASEVLTEEMTESVTEEAKPFSQNFELLPFLPEDEIAKERVALTEDGELLISIMVMDGHTLYQQLGEAIKTQLESIGFVVELNFVDQGQYAQAMYMTGNYDFAIGEIPTITEIAQLEALVELYGINVGDDIFWLIENIVSTEDEALQLQSVERLYHILENQFLFIPLGRAYAFSAVSTYWQDYVVTPTTAAPQKLYKVTERAMQ